MIVRNDNHNTFEHVARTLATVLPGVSLDQGHRIAEQIHNTGQAIVWSGPREPAEHYWSQLEAAGLTRIMGQHLLHRDLDAIELMGRAVVPEMRGA